MRRTPRPPSTGLRFALCFGVVWSCSTASADASEAPERARAGLNTGGQLNVLSEGVAMPHDRPHLGPGVIPTERYFVWKVGILEEHELQWYLGFTPQATERRGERGPLG